MLKKRPEKNPVIELSIDNSKHQVRYQEAPSAQQPILKQEQNEIEFQSPPTIIEERNDSIRDLGVDEAVWLELEKCKKEYYAQIEREKEEQERLEREHQEMLKRVQEEQERKRLIEMERFRKEKVKAEG